MTTAICRPVLPLKADEREYIMGLRQAKLLEIDTMERRLGYGVGKMENQPRTAYLRDLVRRLLREGRLEPEDVIEKPKKR